MASTGTTLYEDWTFAKGGRQVLSAHRKWKLCEEKLADEPDRSHVTVCVCLSITIHTLNTYGFI